MHKSSAKNKIRLGFVGLGEHQSRAHLQHLITLERQGLPIELVAGYDPNRDAFAAWPMLAQTNSDIDVLTNTDIDAVFIGSPDRFHAKQLATAVASGKHVFAEKPMAVSATDLELLGQTLQTARESGLVVTTCHPRRFDPPFNWLYEQLPQMVKKHGRLVHLDFTFYYHEVTDAWKCDERKLLSDHFGHEIDLLRYLLGPAQLGAETIFDRHDGYEVTGVANGNRFSPERFSFRFYGSRHLVEKVYRETLRLDFEKTSLYFYINTGAGCQLPTGEIFSFPPMDYDSRFLAVNRNFINTIRGLERPYLSQSDLLCNNTLSVLLSSDGKADWRKEHV